MVFKIKIMKKLHFILPLLVFSMFLITATNNASAIVVKVKLVDENGVPLANYPPVANELSYKYRCGGTWIEPGSVQTDANGQFLTEDISCSNWDGKITLTLNQTSSEQVVSNDETLFQAAKVNVSLKNCPGEPLDGGTVQQGGGHWVTHGITDASGTVSFYAFPGKSVTARMSYHYGSNTSSTAVVSPETQIGFVTTKVNFQAATVQVGVSGWPTVNMPYEMLSGTYNFKIDGTTVYDVEISGCEYPPVINVVKLDEISTTSETCLFKGTVTVIFSGGTGPYKISWNGSGEEGVSSPYNIVNLDAGDYTVTVTDANGNEVSQDVTIADDTETDEPIINEIIANPATPVSIGTAVELKIVFRDENLVNAQIVWGDGVQDNFDDQSDELIASHTYNEVGVNSVIVILTDDCGNKTTMNYDFVVVYDPSAGFVTGGGWINSPAGAYKVNPELTGKATFGFVAKYKKGATIPDGNTEFQFHAAGMNFKSNVYDWLVIAGMKAQFKGSGTINNSGDYGFMLTAIDGNPDKFRIKIWNKNTDEKVYDNQIENTDDNADPSTALGGGSIVIHTPKTKSAVIGVNDNLIAIEKGVKVYPNPFSDKLYFKFVSPSDVNVRIDLFDMNGSLVKTIFEQSVAAEQNYEAEFKPDKTISGFYIYRIVFGDEVQNGKVIFKKE